MRKIVSLCCCLIIAAMLLLSQSAYASLVWNGKTEQWVQGEGTEVAPYLLETPQHLAYLSKTVANGTDSYEGKFFRQTEDFDMNGSTGYLFTPIGTDSSHPFKGNYDGGKKSIENIQITYANNIKNCALFGYVSGSTIQNLTINSISYATTESVTYVAAFVAYMVNGKILNCVNNSEINFNATSVGAIVANAESVEMTKCKNNANITTSSSNVGGLIGNASGTTISGCLNKGNVANSATTCTNTGGLCGVLSSGDVYKSGNQGAVSSKGKGTVYNYTVYSNATTGGLIGHYFSGTMDQCYNTGNVSSPTNESNSYTGGLFSYDYARYAGTSMLTKSNKVLSNSYVVCNITGYYVFAVATGYSTSINTSNCYYVGKLTGSQKAFTYYSANNSYYINNCGYSGSEGQSLSESLMKSVSFPMSLNNNADDIYVLDEENINNGYPILAWQLYGISIFEISVTCDEKMGTVSGGGTYNKNETAIIFASPKEGYVFLGWSDGSTDNPRTIQVTNDTLLTAVFEKSKCIVDSGVCGTNGSSLVWELYCDSVLMISGSGYMSRYSSQEVAPWYEYRTNIKSIVLEEGLKNVSDYAFYCCENIQSITLPNSVTEIGQRSFAQCISLKSIILSENLYYIRYHAFENCSSLASLHIPQNVYYIDKEAFYMCKGLETLSVSPNNSYYDCRNDCNAIIQTNTNTLIAGCANTVIPNTVTKIGGYAFHGRLGLESIDIPNSVTSLEEWAFAYCKNLKSLVIPQGDTIVPYGLLDGCENLVSVRIPDNVTSIENYAFMGCQSLQSIKLPNSLREIKYVAFNGCNSLDSIIFPDSVTTIGMGAFSNCENVSYVSFGERVNTIKEQAFWGCSKIKSLLFPKSVEHIEGYAFIYCSNTESIICESLIPPVAGEKAFSFVNHEIPLYVPYESLEAYQAADEWKDFKNILPIGGYPCENVVTFLSDTIYYGDSLRFGLTFVKEPGIYRDTLVKASDGCDSIIQLYLFVMPVLLHLSDEVTAFEADYYYDGIDYTRIVGAGDAYAAFCLPFDIKLSENEAFEELFIPLGIALQYADRNGDDVLKVLFTPAKEIEAGVPFLAKLANGHETTLRISTSTNEIVSGVSAQTKTITPYAYQPDNAGSNVAIPLVGEIQWIGTFAGREAQNFYALQPDGMLNFNEDAETHPFRAFLTVANMPTVKKVIAVVDGEEEETALETVFGTETRCTKIIINGQLFILKGDKTYNVTGQVVR